MALDEALLEAMPRLQHPVLRLYSWTQPAASFGYFQKHSDVERLTPLRPLVRRPTAGGIVPHAADWTYSLTFPVSHPWYSLTATQSYLRVHQWLQTSFSLLDIPTEIAPEARKTAAGQCFTGFERSDLLWQQMKIAGAAQRRTRAGLLVQGSVQPPSNSIGRDRWEAALREAGAIREQVQWAPLKMDADLQRTAAHLAASKYESDAYNHKR